MLPKAKMPTLKDTMHIVKIAVETGNQQAQLIEFDQRTPLTGIIQDLCQNWKIADAENYALQFCETKKTNNKTSVIRYITEKNRNEVKNGWVLRLEYSPSKMTNDILKTIKGDSSSESTIIEKTQSLKLLSTLSADTTFASEFIKEQGLNILIAMIEDEKLEGEMRKYVLLAFVELMDHGTVSWDILEPSFILRNIHFITLTNVHPEIIQCALSNLDNIVQHSTNAYIVEKEVTTEQFLRLLRDSKQQVIQQNTLSLINSLFQKADEKRKKQYAETFSTTAYRNVLLSSVIQTNIGTEMAHQLYVLQTLTLGLLEQRMMTKMSPQDQDALDKIKELRQIVFNDHSDSQPDVTVRRQNAGSHSNHYKKLGFKCDINPAQDFIEAPPGMLALDCMVYFARNYTQIYTKVVHENSCRGDEHECPFGRTSIELVKLMCEILQIGELPSEQRHDFHPMFFTHDHPFEELFCICIEILNKTWKDMRATTEDFVKVFSVVQEQVTRSLKERPSNFTDFKVKIKGLTYTTITQLRQQERNSKEECESTASAIVHLKEKLAPEIVELIKAQRLGYLVEGTRFNKYSRGNREKNKYWYARLSPNHRVIHHGECDEKAVPILEELPNKINVVDIKTFLIGKDVPKDVRLKHTNLAFSITLENTEPAQLHFVAPDDITFCYWTDAINALLKQPMTSKQKDEDFETLLSMEIKLRLLDTEGVDISCEPPPVPEDPDNYDFCFES